VLTSLRRKLPADYFRPRQDRHGMMAVHRHSGSVQPPRQRRTLIAAFWYSRMPRSSPRRTTSWWIPLQARAGLGSQVRVQPPGGLVADLHGPGRLCSGPCSRGTPGPPHCDPGRRGIADRGQLRYPDARRKQDREDRRVPPSSNEFSQKHLFNLGVCLWDCRGNSCREPGPVGGTTAAKQGDPFGPSGGGVELAGCRPSAG
jgi:hypothetical protein